VGALLAAGTLLAALTIFQSVTGTFDDNFGGLAQYRVSEISGGEDAPRPSGTLADANYYGQLLIMVMPVALFLMFEGRSRPVKALGAMATAILAGGIVFTYSRGDALALGAMVVAAVIYKRPPAAAILTGIVLLVIAVPLLPGGYVARLSTVVDTALGRQETILNEASIRGRAGAVAAAFGMFRDYPVLGVGRENYASYELDYIAGTSYAYSGKGIPPHDLYLEIAAEHGIVGIVFFAGLFLATFGALREARRRFLHAGDRPQAELAAWLGIGLFGYLVSSLFLHGAYLYMLWLQIALITALRKLARTASEEARLAARERGFTRTAEGV
jgi:O-antigen ligase